MHHAQARLSFARTPPFSESGVNGRMLLYESLVYRPATHSAVGEQVVCHTVPNEYLADDLSEVGPASIGALLAKRWTSCLSLPSFWLRWRSLVAIIAQGHITSNLVAIMRSLRKE